MSQSNLVSGSIASQVSVRASVSIQGKPLTRCIFEDRDSGKFNFTPEETTKRRSIMWEAYTIDLWQSFCYGRPPAFSLFHIDAKMPYDTTLGPGGEVEMSFAAWKHRFISQCVRDLQNRLFSSQTTLNYKTILALDKKIREFYVPPSLLVPGLGGAPVAANADEQPSTDLTFQRHMTFVFKEMTVFYMHRGFFAKALEESPDDPLTSKYSASVYAVYNTACTFVAVMQNLHSQHPLLMERLWFYLDMSLAARWVTGGLAALETFCSSINACYVQTIFASIAERRQMILAQAALENLEAACQFFARVKGNPRVVKVLPLLRRMTERPRNTFQPHEAQMHLASSDKDSQRTPIAAPATSASSTDRRYSTTTTGPKPPPPFSLSLHQPGPVWQDYNKIDIEGFGANPSAGNNRLR